MEKNESSKQKSSKANSFLLFYVLSVVVCTCFGYVLGIQSQREEKSSVRVRGDAVLLCAKEVISPVVGKSEEDIVLGGDDWSIEKEKEYNRLREIHTAEGERVCTIPGYRTRYYPPFRRDVNRDWNLTALNFIILKNSIVDYRGAYVTMITSTNFDYLLSVLVLRKSMALQKSRYPFVLLVTLERDQIPHNISESFDMIVKVPDITDRKSGYYSASMWTKLNTVALIKFDKVVWIGADVLILRNIDSAFDCPPPCGVPDEHLWNMSHIGTVINGDFLVLRPSLDDYENLVRMVRTFGEKQTCDYTSSADGKQHFRLGPIDQGILNTYYGRYMTILPKVYQHEMGSSVNIDEVKHRKRQDTMSIHFPGHSKPWWASTEESLKFWCPIAKLVTNQTIPKCIPK